IRLASGTQHYLDLNADRAIQAAARKILSVASAQKRAQQDSPNYLVMAALVGFVIIFFTIIFSL
ncbi:MAG: hypothetical protein JW839_05230, partial [Candidatus Lokiarchaeota archaeon]|nr:hypothetical protein [Candidatus Lokiarchaeota archaeon]